MKKFSEINELKSSTYRSAATKLSKLGGVHKKRAEDIEKWSYLSQCKEFGTYLFSVKAFEHEYSIKRNNVSFLQKEIVLISDVSSLSSSDKLIKQSPIELYPFKLVFDVCGSSIEEILENKDPKLYLSFWIYSEEFMKTYTPFNIVVDISKNDDDSFSISNKPVNIEYAWNETESKDLLANRSEALRFKRNFLNKESLQKILYCEGDKSMTFRELFMEYSTADDYLKFLNKICSISVNQLYK